jgi:hypothetical protein
MTKASKEVTIQSMDGLELQELCERGQALLMRMEYLEAERTLASAEQAAWAARDWDALARLYLPLQEARRQRRQRCGEGVVCLDLLAEGPGDQLDARHVIENFPHGQLLVAGWGSLAPAVALRQLQGRFGLYVETFLGAVFPVTPSGVGEAPRVVVVAPREGTTLPAPDEQPLHELMRKLPSGCLLLPVGELPQGAVPGSTETYGNVMALWERLHRPFLAAADGAPDPLQQMEGYRATIGVDYACELAHQKLSDVAHQLGRQSRQGGHTLSI